MLSKFRSMRSHTKLFLLFIATIIIPTSIISFISYRTLYTQIQTNVVSSNKREILQLTENLNERFSKIISAAHLIGSNENIQNSLFSYYSGSLSAEQLDSDIGNFTKQYKSFTNDASSFMSSISLITNDNLLVGNRRIEAEFSTPEFQTYLENYRSSHAFQSYSWISSTELFNLPEPTHDSFIYLLFELHDQDTWTSHSILVFAFRESDLLRQYMGNVINGQAIYIQNSSKHTVSKFDNLNLFNSPNDFYQNILNIDQSEITEFQNTSLLITDCGMTEVPWRVISLINMDVLLSKITLNMVTFTCTILFFIILSLVLSFFVSRKFMAPIQKLNASVHRVSQGDLNARVEITTKDEIGQLSQHFNQMLDHTQSLMNVIIEEQAAKRKADIASLQAQINPHFLYNTLTSIRYMSLVGKKEDVDTAILALNSILKCALSDTESFVSINMEMEQLKNYLIIAKYGFSVPLKVNMDIEPELGNCKTIKLILQPIVENAVIHGLKGNLNDPTLSIRVYSENDSVCFLVHDNGVGFDVSSLPKKKALSDSNHIGVHNVNARIQLYFGSDYGIHIESQPGTGTKVWVKIPKISGEGSICHEYFNR